MSALGQKQTFAVQNGMSALPPKADMGGPLDCGKKMLGVYLNQPIERLRRDLGDDADEKS